MKRRDFFVQGAVVLAGAALLPLGFVAESPTKAKSSLLSIPLHKEIVKCAILLEDGFEQHRTFIYQARSGQIVFNVYDANGCPTFNELALIAYCPPGAEKDFDGGRVAGFDELMTHPLGSRSYGLPVSRQDTPESIRSAIVAALRKVTS